MEKAALFVSGQVLPNTELKIIVETQGSIFLLKEVLTMAILQNAVFADLVRQSLQIASEMQKMLNQKPN